MGRLIQAVLPPSHHRRFLGGLHARHTTAVFVGLDILAAVVQSAGTVVAASANWFGPRALTGVDVLVAGLALQTAAFVAFVVVLARFAYVTREKGDGCAGVHAVARHNAPAGWRRLVVAEAVSAVLILVSFCPCSGKTQSGVACGVGVGVGVGVGGRRLT